MHFTKTASLTALMLACGASAYAAQEFSIGAAVSKNGIEIAPNYLTGIMVEGMTAPMGPDEVHLEADIHASADEQHGFKKGEWMPYLTVHYTLEKVGSSFKKTGTLMPMTAGDGPHYANNLAMGGPGQYHLTYTIDPPSKNGFLRHIDKETGVPTWWDSTTADWTFMYPVKGK